MSGIPGVEEHDDVRRVANDAAHDAVEPYTDVANALRFVEDHGGALRYCHERGWMRYDGGRWLHDELHPLVCGQRTARGLAAEAAVLTEAKETGKIVDRLLSSKSIHAMLALARASVAVRASELDADPWLYNCANGTLDLRTGALGPHDPGQLLTKVVPVAFDPAATAPTWDAFLARVLPDVDVRAFVQRLVGYALTGAVREHVLPIFWGRGANGKSTFLEAVQHVMGDYARTIAADVLMASQGERHPTDRAQLWGLRFAVANESDAGRTLAEGTVKQLTGGDRISARFMRQDFFEFAPTHKLALCTNHKPRIKGTDEGIWRRVLLVPWTVTIPAAERDTALGEKLRGEAPGVLNWCLWGCAAWQQQGLAPPEAVRVATAQFKAELDRVGEFLEARCAVEPNAKAWASELYQAYQQWCERSGQHAPTKTAFGLDLAERGFDSKKVGGVMRYTGLRLLTPEELRQRFRAEPTTQGEAVGRVGSVGTDSVSPPIRARLAPEPKTVPGIPTLPNGHSAAGGSAEREPGEDDDAPMWEASYDAG